MEHPLLFEPGDPLVDRVRALCLRLPESIEALSHGRPTFFAGKRVFALVGSSMDRPNTLVFKPDPEESRALRQDPRIFIPPYWGPSGWLAIDLDTPATDWQEIAELIETSYRQVALKRQLAVLDGIM
ncbi:MmcQ/YjbR family DNA-binding protein [Leifsonia sp. NPDC058230]|uniref:MmcQ/YjbR family DNA-binding protein n=1 Tax=Leifsonia sp. NPDC058230 TaxID=3346391 RepID=UPI0036DEB104